MLGGNQLLKQIEDVVDRCIALEVEFDAPGECLDRLVPAALSPAGRYVGGYILGRFFLENRHKSPAEAKKAAQTYFAEFAPMVRPLKGYSGTPPLGTIEDRQVKACFSTSSHEAFGIVVCVRTDSSLNAVMMPAFTAADSVAAYFEFLKNDRETIFLEHCQYDAEKDHWAGTGEPVEMRWPKDSETFEFP
jgi:hypothetical protein